MSLNAKYYSSSQQAEAAVRDLLAAGFAEKSIASIDLPAPDAEGESPGAGPDVTATLKAGKLLGDMTDYYASFLSPGNSLVVVRPVFGRDAEATSILQRHHPLDIAPDPRYSPRPPKSPDANAAPFSAAFGFPVLSENKISFSDFWGLKTLADEDHTWLSRWFSPLTRSGFTFSGLFGLKLLSNNPAPLSSLFRMSVKSDRSGNRLTRSFGMPLLSDQATPLSSRLGLPVLSSRERFLYK